MNNAMINLREPSNEPIYSYIPGSPEYNALMKDLEKMSSETIEIPLIIGGKEVCTGDMGKVVSPHNHKRVLANYHKAGEKEVKMAVDAALAAKDEWANMPWIERAAIFMRMAELMSKKYRYMISAATMLGQSKNIFQSEIDSVCEGIDFLRFNSYFASKFYTEQPMSDNSTLNRLEYRPLEGFVFAVSPFNFTAIGLNLCASPALMGNTVVWKPATTAIYSNYFLMKLYKEAGLPDGVINFLPGSGSVIGSVVLNHKDLAAIHFTGGTNTFDHFWKTTANNVDKYVSYPKLIGETGGKDFVLVHNSACPQEVAVGLARGAFEYQGQKCSAASRAYIPQSRWAEIKEKTLAIVKEMKMGDVNDPNNFVNAVIDKASFDNIMGYIKYAAGAKDAEIICGGKGDDAVGYFIEPTIIVTTDPHFKTMEEEIFGPVLTIYVYKDEDFDKTMKILDETSPYALTGSIFAKDRSVLAKVYNTLRYAAGNFYYNDKPSGAVVGNQPFGGARKSGTNDKAGSYLNLVRWTSPRTIKENFCPPTDFRYGYMNK